MLITSLLSLKIVIGEANPDVFWFWGSTPGALARYEMFGIHELHSS